jgi:hypothetical protein
LLTSLEQECGIRRSNCLKKRICSSHKTAQVLQTHAGKKLKKISNFVSISTTMTFMQFGRLVLTFWSNVLSQRVATLRMAEFFSEMLVPTNQITEHCTPSPCFTLWLCSWKKICCVSTTLS